ncbi:MAG: Na+/H+ antiporter NhaC [Deltaproteobacteria bacterium]|nr:MAG: Na+/H+ antiporter NhaC [Deltaproteobacteria bacterium]
MAEENIKPSFGFSIAVMSVIVVMLVGGLSFLHVDMHMLLIACTIVVVLASIYLGHRWDDILDAIIHGISRALAAVLFFILIGMAVGAWVASGTVPALIYYGLNLLTPMLFLPAGLIIGSIASLATGSSWSTAGTVGVALMGIGLGMNIPAPLIAGMVISGAYFGDKMSPLSDTTNLAPAIAGTDVFSHIRAMLYTTIPAYLISLALFFVFGLKYADQALDASQIETIQNLIAGNFNLNIMVLLPIVVVLILSVMKFPAIPAMIVGIVVAIPVAVFFQGASFVSVLEVLNYGFSIETGSELVDKLLNRGGVQSMMWTLSLALVALSLGGALTHSKLLTVIFEKVIEKVHSARYYPGMVIVSGVLTNALVGEQYMGVVVPGELYRESFEQKGLEPRMLSRCLEEGATLTANFFPWSTGGAFMFGALGVYNFAYMPYAFFNYINPILGILLPVFGLTLLRKKQTDKDSKTDAPH